MHRFTALVISYAFIVLMASCTSTPASRFYTLSTAPPPAVPASAATASNLSVVVGPVSVPSAVDRPEIVVTMGPNQVQLDEFNRWASPLQNDISRVVAQNLVAMLSTPHVFQYPQKLIVDIGYYATIEVQAFESALGEAATLDAVWTVRRPKDGKSTSGRTTVREAVPQNGFNVLVAAHSRAIARLSRDIADAVRTLDRAAVR